MFRKAIFSLLLSLIFLGSVFALEVDQFPENQTQTNSGDIAKMKGELTVTIDNGVTRVQNRFTKELEESEERTKKLIEERTNPFIMNMPTMFLIIIFGLIWVILKARGKV